MDASAPSGEKKASFKNPKRFLASLDAETTARVIASAADIALVIEKGVIKDIAIGNAELSGDGFDAGWRGKRWVDTVAQDSRGKVADLLVAATGENARWREVNHVSPNGRELPVQYIAVATGADDRIVALGRELRSISKLQQRLVDAHQNAEREYDRLRDAEARYRMLFDVVSEAVLIVEAETFRIMDANRAAGAMLNRRTDQLAGADFYTLFKKAARGPIETAIMQARASGATRYCAAAVVGAGQCDLSISAFRHGSKIELIVAVSVNGAGANASARSSTAEAFSVLEELPDALVVTDEAARILVANKSFFAMAHLTDDAEAGGLMVSEFVGRSSTDFNVLLSNLRNYGVVRNFSTVFRDRIGVEDLVEVSAVATSAGDAKRFAFSIRSVAKRLDRDQKAKEELPSSPDQLTGLVGKMPLKEIVRESADIIERLCIEAALEMTGDNRASAAEMLGLSRQGLYSKLKRFDIDL